jgi:hypothetical protein
MCHGMNIPASPNPFSGLKATLARILSGGWMGLVLGLLFQRRIHAALSALESLFAQWQAGTLPLPAVAIPARGRTDPLPRATARQVAGSRARRPAGRRRPVIQAATLRVRPAAWHRPGAVHPLAPSPCALRVPRRRARCSENADGKACFGTPILFRYRN